MAHGFPRDPAGYADSSRAVLPGPNLWWDAFLDKAGLGDRLYMYVVR